MPTTNPLREGLIAQRVPAPCTMVIFGASGDLNKRKLIPALYSLSRDRLLPNAFAVVGYARRPLPEWVPEMREACNQFARKRPVEADVWDHLAEGMSYVQGEFDNLDHYKALKEHLEKIDRERGTQGNRVFYLSTPPSYYATIIEHLGKAGLINKSGGAPFTRVIVEKPFGTDLKTAQELNGVVQGVLREDQTYRIDHYLGKETVQNIFVLRFGNSLFEPLWNSKYIDSVQLTVAEAIGIEGRGGYFEEAGMTRDMVQNHMFQFFALMAMEPPIAFEADAIRDEKAKVLRSLRPLAPADVARDTVRAQYGEGAASGEKKGGYKSEKGVAADSVTETYVAMKVHIDNWRWAGVPFYIRAGKALAKKVTEIAIQFKQAPPLYWGDQQALSGEHRARGMSGIQEPNGLTIRIQPDEGISLRFTSKVPGQSLEVTPVSMEFRYGSSFGAEPPEAYERLLLDCLLGDSTLFTRADEVEASWRWIDNMFRGWKEANVPLAKYAFGDWGPAESDELLGRDGRTWRRP